jgi:hypothetical protein
MQQWRDAVCPRAVMYGVRRVTQGLTPCAALSLRGSRRHNEDIKLAGKQRGEKREDSGHTYSTIKLAKLLAHPLRGTYIHSIFFAKIEAWEAGFHMTTEG